MDGRYQFGTGAIAGRRLRLLAEVFAESTQALLAQAAAAIRPPAESPPALVIDLGCGPGFTTRLIAATLHPRTTLGLDSAPSFIAEARAYGSDKITYAQHDVTTVPFPLRPASVIFCRFLLTHLPDPAAVIGRWAAELEPGGLLVIEETERITTAAPVFREYLQLVEAMLASQAQTLYAGRLLAPAIVPSPLQVVAHTTRVQSVRDAAAAQMFALNLRTWRSGSYVQRNYAPERIEALTDGLAARANDTGTAANITWTLRHLILRRS